MLLLDIPNTLGAHESAPRLPERRPDALIACRLEAQDRIAADVDLFTDWLAGQCAQQPVQELGYVPTNPTSVGQMVEVISVPKLVAWLMYPNTEVAGRAAWELRERFIRDQDAHIERMAAELMAQGWAE